MTSHRRALALLALLLSPQVMALELGATPPNLGGQAADGRMLTLSQFHGQVVYVDFWASWCAPCAEAIPVLDSFQQKYGDRGFTVLGVNVDSERRSAQRMIDHLSPGFPMVFDPQGKWPEAFGLKDMPTSYLIDAHGVIRYINTGYRARDAKQIEAAIKAALGEN